MAWGPQPHQISSLALVRGGAGGAAKIASYGPGTYTFTAPVAGTYFFALTGAGGAGTPTPISGAVAPGGGGAGYTEGAAQLVKGASIPVLVGFGGRRVSTDQGLNIIKVGQNTSVSLPDVLLLVTPGANPGQNSSQGGLGGIGQNGSLNLTGGNGGNSNGGSGTTAGSIGGGSFPGAGGGFSVNPWAAGGGGAAGTLLHPGIPGGFGSQGPSGDAGAGVQSPGGGFAASFGTDARVSVYWLG